jgi:hypothetical protein
MSFLLCHLWLRLWGFLYYRHIMHFHIFLNLFYLSNFFVRLGKRGRRIDCKGWAKMLCLLVCRLLHLGLFLSAARRDGIILALQGGACGHGWLFVALLGRGLIVGRLRS